MPYEMIVCFGKLSAVFRLHFARWSSLLNANYDLPIQILHKVTGMCTPLICTHPSTTLSQSHLINIVAVL